MLRFSRWTVTASSFCFLTANVSFGQSPRPMTLVDVLNVPQITDPQLAPNGREILFVKAEANWKANKRIRHIWRINADGSGLVEMTNGADSETNPRWSPDGKTIAFLAKRGESEGNQILLISPGGGEARTLTNHPTGVSDVTWSPDGASLYFRAPDPKTDQQKAREKLKDDISLFEEDYQQQHLWNVKIDGKSERRVTEGSYSVIAYHLSEDGTKIAYHRAPSPLLEDADQSEVWMMESS